MKKLYRNRLIIFFLISVFVYALMHVYFAQQTNVPLKFRVYAILALGESVLLSVPVVVLNGRWKRITVYLVWVVSIFYLANLLYFRYWSDFIPIKLIFSVASYNVFIFKAIPQLLKWTDFILLALPLIYTVSFVKLHCIDIVSTAKSKLILTVFAIFAFLSGEFGCAISHYRYLKASSNTLPFSQVLKEQFSSSVFRKENFYSKGLLYYVFFETGKALEIQNISVTEEERLSINRFIDDFSNCAYREYIGNSRKNLIFIIVESLNSKYIGYKINNRAVTPILDSLLNCEGSISALEMIPQVVDGGSSDGQLIYNTGLLPINSGPSAIEFGENTFPSIAKELKNKGFTTIEYIFESKGVWNHGRTSVAYGYDSIVSNMQADGRSYDKTIFDEAFEGIMLLNRPFFSEITTLSMHMPFDDPGVPQLDWILNSDTIPQLQQKYLCALHEFDKQLGVFLERIDSVGLADSTLIVLASDHDQYTNELERVHEAIEPQKIAFIALRTNHTEKIQRTVAQVDVYPTILSLMGVTQPHWQGVGMSILDTLNCSAVDKYGNVHGAITTQQIINRKRRAWQVSDSIIRSNFFEW